MAFVHPEYLVETDWLATHLNDPQLRILDCTIVVQDARRSKAKALVWKAATKRGKKDTFQGVDSRIL